MDIDPYSKAEDRLRALNCNRPDEMTLSSHKRRRPLVGIPLGFNGWLVSHTDRFYIISSEV